MGDYGAGAGGDSDDEEESLTKPKAVVPSRHSVALTEEKTTVRQAVKGAGANELVEDHKVDEELDYEDGAEDVEYEEID